ncbi:MAG TPA: putative colanic acid biosynthesis acetyltransferase [Nitrospira sp.]|nr:putative colanic acid biosynthesis acetyltransferase [Nitrospira sp.]
MKREQSALKMQSTASIDLARCARFNYTLAEYAGRLLWTLCWMTLWKLAWKRLYVLRVMLLRLFGATMPLKNQMAGSTWIEMPWNLKMEEYSSLGPRVTIYNLGKITIGRNTVISQDAYLCGGSHDYTRSTMPLIKADITIGDDVWICAGAFIGPGVTVGEGAVVGARAVVVADVAPWTVVGGNPARVLKQRQLRR